jgi:hypothetical protein
VEIWDAVGGIQKCVLFWQLKTHKLKKYEVTRYKNEDCQGTDILSSIE